MLRAETPRLLARACNTFWYRTLLLLFFQVSDQSLSSNHSVRCDLALVNSRTCLVMRVAAHLNGLQLNANVMLACLRVPWPIGAPTLCCRNSVAYQSAASFGAAPLWPFSQ